VLRPLGFASACKPLEGTAVPLAVSRRTIELPDDAWKGITATCSALLTLQSLNRSRRPRTHGKTACTNPSQPCFGCPSCCRMQHRAIRAGLGPKRIQRLGHSSLRFLRPDDSAFWTSGCVGQHQHGCARFSDRCSDWKRLECALREAIEYGYGGGTWQAPSTTEYPNRT
jgi:hypothetical protein